MQSIDDPRYEAGAGGRPAPSGTRREHLRERNLSAALAHVVDATTPPSRAQLAARTGLARPSVTPLVEQLVRAGMIRELLPLPTKSAGRPAVPLAPAAGTFAGIGMEISVGYLGLQAVDLAGGVLVERVEAADLRRRDPEAVLDRLGDLAISTMTRLAANGVRVVGTTLALPGLVDRMSGPLRVAPNLGWRDVDVVALFTRRRELAGLPPRLANQANLAALAEAHIRRGQPGPSFVYVSGEAGIGSAIVLDGEIFSGLHGYSGEIGRVVVDPSAPGGPRRGTLEERAGREAMLRGAGLPPMSPVHDLVAAVELGDERARIAVRRAGRALGVALADVINTVDVSQVVLGGAMGALFDHVHDEVQRALDELVISAPWSSPEVSRSRARPFPAMTGGALSVLRELIAAPSAWFDARPVAARDR